MWETHTECDPPVGTCSESFSIRPPFAEVCDFEAREVTLVGGFFLTRKTPSGDGVRQTPLPGPPGLGMDSGTKHKAPETNVLGKFP